MELALRLPLTFNVYKGFKEVDPTFNLRELILDENKLDENKLDEIKLEEIKFEKVVVPTTVPPLVICK
jgi:hypothetical protein